MPRYVYQLCLGLPRLRPDWHFHFFVNSAFQYNEAREAFEPRLRRLQEYPNVSIVNEDSDGEMYWEQIVLPRLVRESQVDLLHMPANRACWRAPVPQVVTVHDTMELRFLSRNMGMPAGAGVRLRAWVWRRCAYVWLNYRFAIRRSAAIVTVSRNSAQDIIRQLRVGSPLVTAIHHGVPQEFAPSALFLRERRFCLMLGGDSFQKNPEGAFAAWALVPEGLRARYPLIVAGFAGQSDSPLLKAIQHHGLGESVRVHGWMSDTDIARLFREAAVFLFVSRYEGFGFPVLQAMASGTPVVCSDSSSLPEIAGGAAWFAPPEEPERIAQGLVTLLTDDGEWCKYRRGGLAQAARFTWEQSMRQHVQVYERVLGCQ
jgi:glycosyltransferase involved in cell wall biosynthesis